MTGCAERASRAVKDFDAEEAERLLLHRYTGLPLLPAGEDGGRCAILARFGGYEVRLTEFPPDSMPFLPLWVELYSESGRVLVDACGFSELEDAVEPCRSSWRRRSGCTTKADLCSANAAGRRATPEGGFAPLPRDLKAKLASSVVTGKHFRGGGSL